MADENSDSEKTEEPSQYRLEEFRKKGEVASSKELSSVFILFGCLITLTLSAVYMIEVLTEYVSYIYGLSAREAYGDKQLHTILVKTFVTAGKCVGPIMLTSLILGVFAQVMQVGLLYAPEALSLKFERINPVNGIKRVISKKAVVEAIKGIAKFTIVIFITYFIMKTKLFSFSGFLHTDFLESFQFGKQLAMQLAFSILLGISVVAALDFAWEKYSYRQKLKLTKQQAKEENKEKEGNPEIRQRIRSVQREMASRRMMEDVKNADVVITNPTHISIVIRYDSKVMLSPEVVAKGADNLALRIRQIAKENDIPMVENVPLARSLYKTVKVGEGVPRTLYKVVAEVLAFVYKLKRKKKALS